MSDRPSDDEFTQKLEEYKNLVYSDEYKGARAEFLNDELSKHFGRDYDVLVELQLYVENREWERDFDKDK
ncbi:Uncharacterised protein [Serratia quinivorans]|uniref:Uncharacterized protein n=1 Tax=Serratia quinivorans TaxID=137545 RepID=A0A379Z185_9GAMM|nr:Uncharacterised protein [Serratia quinivorans]